ncbi:TPA: hypothetical protein HA251_03275 [Candidatus Woesearchaeota archaeon]|nr:hypothetical protein [Candidatus Woesearchaeota archaeon]
MALDDQDALLGFKPLFDMPEDARFRMISRMTHPRGYSLYAYVERQRRCCIVGYQDKNVHEEILLRFEGGRTDVGFHRAGPPRLEPCIDNIVEHVPYFIDVLGLKDAHVQFRDILDDHYRSLLN